MIDHETQTSADEHARLEAALRKMAEERDQARAEAEAERGRLRLLLTQAPAIIAVVRGPDHVFELVNPGYERAVGRRAADLLGKAAGAVLPELAEQGFSGLIDRVHATGEPFVATEMPVRLDRRGDGTLEEAFYSFVLQPLRDAGGAVDGLMVHAVDVTDLVRARRRTEWLQEITVQLGRSLAPDAVVRHAVDAAAALLATEVAALFVLEQPDGDFTLAAAHGLDEIRQRLPHRPRLAGLAVDDRRARAIDDAAGRDDVVLPLLAAGGPIGAVAGAPLLAGDEAIGMLEVYDPRPRRWSPDDLRLLEALAAAAAVAITNARLHVRLEEAIRTRDDFLTAASHDLKNPLTAVRGSVQMLERALERTGAIPSERLGAALRTIGAAVTRLTGQVDELVDVARARLDQPLPLERARTDLVGLARTLTAAHQASSERHRLMVEAAVPALVGEWDGRRLTRVLDNLLSNAVKYSPDGGDVTVSVAREDGWAVMTVRDRGLGIPAADLPRVLDRFERAGNVRGRIAGTGIGLAAARQVVEAHGGAISLESEEGRGTIVTVRLPLGMG